MKQSLQQFKLYYESLKHEKDTVFYLTRDMRREQTIDFIKQTARQLNDWRKRPKTLHIKPLNLKVVITVALIVVMWPHPHKVIYAEPTPSPVPKIEIKHFEPLQASLTEQEHKEPIYSAPAPVSAPAPSAGVTDCGDSIYKQFIYQQESGCRTNAVNPIGACGLGQALPCSKMGCSLSDWACQDAFFTNYAVQRYGSWEQAYYFWQAHNWW